MQELLDAGIIDLGGTGERFLEIEYVNSLRESKEAFYRIPDSCLLQDIISGNIVHLHKHSTLVIRFNQHEPFYIQLPDVCEQLVEVRLPDAVGGDTITDQFV